MLYYLQSLQNNNGAASILKVYVAAISAHHVIIDGQPLGSHALVAQFLRGAQRLCPPQTIHVPSWDLSLRSYPWSTVTLRGFREDSVSISHYIG